MKNLTLLTIALTCLMLACKNKEQKTTDKPEQQKQEKNFFPVADYIKSEIAYVDSIPVGLVKFTTINGKKDSAFIKTEDFDKLAKSFLPKEIADSMFEAQFDETSFFDQTTQLSTFTYSTKNPNLKIQRVDVVAEPNSGFSKVRSIYMEEKENVSDTLITRKMYWRSKKSFDIITLTQFDGQQTLSNQLRVVWDNRD